MRDSRCVLWVIVCVVMVCGCHSTSPVTVPQRAEVKAVEEPLVLIESPALGVSEDEQLFHTVFMTPQEGAPIVWESVKLKPAPIHKRSDDVPSFCWRGDRIVAQFYENKSYTIKSMEDVPRPHAEYAIASGVDHAQWLTTEDHFHECSDELVGEPGMRVALNEQGVELSPYITLPPKGFRVPGDKVSVDVPYDVSVITSAQFVAMHDDEVWVALNNVHKRMARLIVVNSRTKAFDEIDLTRGGLIDMKPVRDSRSSLWNVNARPLSGAEGVVLVQWDLSYPRDTSKAVSSLFTTHVALIDLRTREIRDVPLDASMEWIAWGYFMDAPMPILTTSVLEASCAGVHTVNVRGELECAELLPDKSKFLFSRYSALLAKERVTWTEQLDLTWSLEQVIEPGIPRIQSHLLSPDGQRYTVGGDIRPTCFPVRDVLNRARPSNKDLIMLSCELPGNPVIQTVVWDTNTLSGRSAVNAKLRADSPPLKRDRSFFAGSPNRWVEDEQGTSWVVEDHVLIPYGYHRQVKGLAPSSYSIASRNDGEVSTLIDMNVGNGTYQALKSYSKKECAHHVSVGLPSLDDERYVVVYCSKPVKPGSYDATLLWSEILDIKSRRVWRTKLAIKAMGPGHVVLSDQTFMGNSTYGNTRRVSVATW